MNWMNVRYFTPQELACKCGKCGNSENMDPEFMTLLDEVRGRVGKPLTVTSGYRCPQHPEEIKKYSPGAHSAGLAADIAVSGGAERFEVLKAAIDVGMVGVGVANGFIHMDFGHPTAHRPAAWKYS